MTATTLSVQQLGGALRRGFWWWIEGLEMAMPSWLLALVLGDRRCVHLDVDETGALRARLAPKPFADQSITATQLAPGAPQSAPAAAIRFAGRSRPVILTAPSDLVLTQKVFVPEAALENLQQAVEFGLSTWTPFEADMLTYHADVIERFGERVRIRIRMIPTSVLEPIVAAAQDAGLQITSVAFGENIVAYARTSSPAARRSGLLRRVDLWLLVLALLLACAIATTLHVRWANELMRLQDAIRTELGQYARQATIQSQLSQIEERRRIVVEKRAREPRVSAIVADLANNLPDTVEVTEFVWSGAQGRIVIHPGGDGDVEAGLRNASFTKSGTPSRAEGDRLAFDLAFKAAAR